MLWQVAKLYLILYAAAVAVAQTYEELESTFDVLDVTKEEDNTANGDEYAETGDEYINEYNDDYDTEDDESVFIKVSFSADKQKELYTCLCMGGHSECHIHYIDEDHIWNVNSIEKNGTFYSDNANCKYYRCSHLAGRHTITCSQVETRSDACSEGGSAQFFQHKSHSCCGSTCVGIFWTSVDEQLSFLHNTSEMEKCNENCLCSAQGEGGTKVTKVTESNMSDGTVIDKYIINKTSEISTHSSTKINKQTSLSFQLLDKSTTTPMKEDSTENLTSFGKSPSYDFREKNEETIVMASVVAVVAAIVVAGCILLGILIFRRRHRQDVKTNVNKNTTGTGNAVILKSEHHLSYTSPVNVSDSPATRYSPLAHENESSTSLQEYQESPKFQGFSKNGGQLADSDTYKNRHEKLQSNLRPSGPDENGPKIDSHSKSEPKGSRGKPSENVDNKHGELKHENNDKSYSQTTSDEQDDGSVKDRSISDSVGRKVGGIDVDKRGLIRKDSGNKVLTGGSTHGDQESRQPLLTFHKVKESVV